MTTEKPADYKYWSKDAQYIYDERVAIMREGNNIADEKPTPLAIIMVATRQVEEFENFCSNKQMA